MLRFFLRSVYIFKLTGQIVFLFFVLECLAYKT